MRFCEKLKEARTKAGLKQEELAKALGVSVYDYQPTEGFPSERSPTMNPASAIRESETSITSWQSCFILKKTTF